LNWPTLTGGTLIKRYKRFLADVRLHDGRVVTAHCPNSGSMRGCNSPGKPVFLSFHDNPKRKLKYTWELIEMPDSLVGINTMVPNRLVAKAIKAGRIPELSGYDAIQPEIRVGSHSRIDLLLTAPSQAACYVEIKNCTLVEDKIAKFPDAVTTRGRKHLQELEQLVFRGYRGVIFYLIQRMDAHAFTPAKHIDPAYAEQLSISTRKGVQVMVYDVLIDLKGIRLRRRLPLL
jgi:sugar fermentation stimulation protein A